jgi:hypothetical protein
MEPKPLEHYPAPKYPTRRDLMLGTVVAPIFKHGEGRGSIGCVVVAPPVFLSEEEAMQIIREELAKHGVNLGGPTTLPDVTIAARVEEIELDFKGGQGEVTTRVREVADPARKPFTLDGVDATKKVAVRFVSEKAYYDLGGPNWGPSSLQPYDFPEVAQYVAAQLTKQGKADMVVGLHYDPAVKVSLWPDALRADDRSEPQSYEDIKAHVISLMARAKAEAGELLRLQSRDFAAWLKQQKVL